MWALLEEGGEWRLRPFITGYLKSRVPLSLHQESLWLVSIFPGAISESHDSHYGFSTASMVVICLTWLFPAASASCWGSLTQPSRTFWWDSFQAFLRTDGQACSVLAINPRMTGCSPPDLSLLVKVRERDANILTSFSMKVRVDSDFWTLHLENQTKILSHSWLFYIQAVSPCF